MPYCSKIDTPFRLQNQYVVLSRRLDTPHPTSGYTVSADKPKDYTFTGSVPGQDGASRYAYGVLESSGYARSGIDHYAFLVLSWHRYAVSSLLDTSYGSSFQNSSNIFILVPELRLFCFWDIELQYDTTTDVSAHYSKTTFALSEQIKSDEDEPTEEEKSEIDPLIREPSDTFLMGDKEIEFSSLKDIDGPVPIPWVFEKPLDSLDPILKTFNMTITNPLFDFHSEFTLNSDNPIVDIQNEESDESETETIMEEVQIPSSQSIAQILPPFSLAAMYGVVVAAMYAKLGTGPNWSETKVGLDTKLRSGLDIV
ncbi:hypothetical protein Tco_1042309 [Tanacetum coccineum]|uniref:Uncharacterized protein n=1 Tax=Tanacetum coccineum TaxID=301880 RepID=A0ABQ5GJU8_9ASTR